MIAAHDKVMVFRFDKKIVAALSCFMLFVTAAVFVNFEYTALSAAVVFFIVLAFIHSSPNIFFIGISTLTFCVLWNAYTDAPFMPFIQDVFLGVSVFLFVAHVVEGRGAKLHWSGLSKGMGLFLLMTLLAAVIGYTLGRPLNVLVLEWHMLLYFAFYFIVLVELQEDQNAKLLLKFVFGGGVIACIQYIGILVAAGKFSRIATYHADMYPMLLTLLAALIVYTPKRNLKVIAGGICVLLLSGLIISLTRAEWAASALSLTILGFFLVKDKKVQPKYILLLGALVLFVSAIVLVFAPDTLTSLTESRSTQQITQRAESFSKTGQDVSLMMRVELDLAAIQRIRQFPILGAGLGDKVAYKFFSNLSVWSLDTSHLTMLWKMGIVGFTVYVALLIRVLRRAYFLFRNTKEPFFKWYSAGFFSGFCGLILLSFFSASLTKYNLNLVWAIMIATVEFGALRIGTEHG